MRLRREILHYRSQTRSAIEAQAALATTRLTVHPDMRKSENRCRHCSLFRVSFSVLSLKTSATHNVTRYAHARFQCQLPFFGRV